MEYDGHFNQLTFRADESDECTYLCGIIATYMSANPAEVDNTNDGANLQSHYMQARGRVEAAQLLAEDDGCGGLMFEERRANLLISGDEDSLRKAAIDTLPTSAAAARTLTLPATKALRDAITWAASNLPAGQPPLENPGNLPDGQLYEYATSTATDGQDAVMAAEMSRTGMFANLWGWQINGPPKDLEHWFTH